MLLLLTALAAGLPGVITVYAWFADATPQEVKTALLSAGSWGAVHEPSTSGPLNVDALAGTNNVLLDVNMFRAVKLQPEALQVCSMPFCAMHSVVYQSF